MNREEARIIAREKLTNDNLYKHVLAAEAIMRALAKREDADIEKWGLAGLLHDLDYEETGEDPKRHGLVTAAILEDMNVDAEIINAVKAHNEALGFERITLMDKALYAADPMTGLLTASALVQPSKKLSDVKVKSVKKKFKSSSFAAGANREQMLTCSEMGMELGEFIELSLNAMVEIADDIGL